MNAIARHGNEQAIQPVCARVRVILRHQRKRMQLPQSELISAFEFLSRYRDDDQVQATLAWVTENRRPYLTDQESQWIREHGLG